MATAGIAPGTWVSLAFINGGGLALRWFRDELTPELIAADDAYARLDDEARGAGCGSGGLLWHPHVQGRVLPPEPNARGAWIGVTSGQSRGHLFRAILEGIAFEYARWSEVVRSTAGTTLREARAVGGGAASSLWNQIKADVLGIDWAPLRGQESGVLGNALIAAAAAGYIDDVAATAEAWQQVEERVHPDPEGRRVYAGLRPAADQLAARLEPVFDALSAAADGSERRT